MPNLSDEIKALRPAARIGTWYAALDPKTQKELAAIAKAHAAGEYAISRNHLSAWLITRLKLPITKQTMSRWLKDCADGVGG